MSAAWPRSSKSSSAARSSNTVAGEGGGDVGSAGLWVGVGASAQPQQFSVVEVHPGVFCQPQSRARACSVFAVVAGRLAHCNGHGAAAWMRCGDGGSRSSRKAGRIGRGHKLPPQLGQIPIKWPSTQRRHKVHS